MPNDQSILEVLAIDNERKRALPNEDTDMIEDYSMATITYAGKVRDVYRFFC